MAVLPDELWRRILEIGAIENSPNILNYKDLCSLSITCRTLKRLSGEDFIWSSFLSSDFSQSSIQSSSAKSQYKLCFERDKEKKALAHKRAVLRIESTIAEHSRRISELRSSLRKEVDRLKAAASELSNLRNVRQASVALNVWQPEIVRGRQRQIVEQCTVNVMSRTSALDMEVKLCKQQIAAFDKARRDEKSRLQAAKEQLASVKYHPLRDYNLPNSSSCSRRDECTSKKKKLKTSNCKFERLYSLCAEPFALNMFLFCEFTLSALHLSCIIYVAAFFFFAENYMLIDHICLKPKGEGHPSIYSKF